jgi:hypothetical protein
VYRSRMAMGDALASEVQRVLAEQNIEVDVVIPVRAATLLIIDVLTFTVGSRHFKSRCVEFGTEAASAVPRGVC